MTLIAEIWNPHVMSLIYANANPLQPGSSLPSKMKLTLINEQMVRPIKKEPISPKKSWFWEIVWPTLAEARDSEDI